MSLIAEIEDEIKESMRAREPTPRHGHGTVKVELIDSEPRGHTSGAGRVALPLVEPMRALARIEHHVGNVEPPRRPAEPFAGFGRLVVGELLIEERPRALPTPLA